MALSQREKRLLLVPLGLAAVVGFYNFVHLPLHTKKAEAAEAYDKVTVQLRQAETKLAKEKDLRGRKEAVAAREKVIDAWVPGKNSAALFIWYLSQAEQKSGGVIRSIAVSDKKTVAAAPQPAQAPGQPQPGQQANPPQQPNQAPTLTVVQLELKVDARFAQHLQFNQSLETMPLFLNTNALDLAKSDKSSSLDDVSKLVAGGNTWLAAQVLSGSPVVNGTYKINLYFKADKAGPVTDAMQFAEAPGRLDPFANIDEFVETIIRFYSGQTLPDGTRGPLPPLPDHLKGQLG